jgi:hypothetical protein
MAKTLFVDYVWSIMHFNSSPQAYRACRDMTLECCYCHKGIDISLTGEIGITKNGTCPNCKEKISYKNILLSENLAIEFNVLHGSTRGFSPLNDGIMHIILPAQHEEFNKLLLHFSGIPQSLGEYQRNEPLFSLFAKVVNIVKVRIDARVQEIHRQNLNFSNARSVLNISNTFANVYGDVISPSLDSKNSISNFPHQEIEYMAIRLEKFLINEFEKDNVENSNMIPIGFEFFKTFFSRN